MKPIVKSIQVNICLFPVQDGVNMEMLYHYVLDTIRNVHENQAGLKLNGTYQLLLYANNVNNVLGENINAVKKTVLNRF
jgi:hypothetical protein